MKQLQESSLRRFWQSLYRKHPVLTPFCSLSLLFIIFSSLSSFAMLYIDEKSDDKMQELMEYRMATDCVIFLDRILYETAELAIEDGNEHWAQEHESEMEMLESKIQSIEMMSIASPKRQKLFHMLLCLDGSLFQRMQSLKSYNKGTILSVQFCKQHNKLIAEVQKEADRVSAILAKCKVEDRNRQLYFIIVVLATLLVGTVALICLIYLIVSRSQETIQSLEQAIGSISHDLRAPISNINGYIACLLDEQDGPLNEKQRDMLKRIERQGKLSFSLITDILNASQITSGLIEMSFEEADLVQLAKRATESVIKLADQKNLEIKEIYKAPEAIVKIDTVKTFQILSNLLTNAIKYTDKGSITLTLYIDEENVYVEIADTGIGIPSSFQPKVFDRFVRIDTKKQSSGIGLGLAIAKKLASIQDGDVILLQSDSNGSTFQLRLPR